MPQEISYDHQQKAVTTKTESATPCCDLKCYSFTNMMGGVGVGGGGECGNVLTLSPFWRGSSLLFVLTQTSNCNSASATPNE